MSNTIPLPATPYVLGIAGDGYSDDHCTSFPAWDDGAMYDHAAAVSAADNAALRERVKVLEDVLENITDITAKETIHKIARAALGDKHD